MKNTTKSIENKRTSTFSNLKRARTINVLTEKATNHFTIVAESDKAYKTSDNKIIRKSDVEKSAIKNTIDYRYNKDSDTDTVYTMIQDRLCDILNVERKTDIRAFETIFSVRTTKRYYNILKSDSVVLNRASSIELLLIQSDADRLKDYDIQLVEKTETKLNKYCSHIKENDVYSLVLKSLDEIQKVASLLA